MTDFTTPRLTELLRMRRFLDAEIALERQKIAVNPTLRTIAAAADLYGTTPEDVTGETRSNSAVNARHLAAWMLRDLGMTYAEIGAALGGRDHTSAIYAVRAIEHDPARRALGVQLLAQEGAA